MACSLEDEDKNCITADGVCCYTEVCAFRHLMTPIVVYSWSTLAVHSDNMLAISGCYMKPQERAWETSSQCRRDPVKQ